MQAPGTRRWSWDITTWPGHLATSGDIADGLMFTRLEDMIDFFDVTPGHRDYYSDGAPSIDVRYWAEKLCGGRSHEVKKYDADSFLQQVREHLEASEALSSEAQDFHERQLALLKVLHEMRGVPEAASQQLFELHWSAEARLAATRGTYGVLNQERRDAASAALIDLWSTDGVTDEQFDELMERHGYHELADIEIPRQSPAERRQEILDDARWHAGSDDEAHTWLSEHEEVVGPDTWEWNLRAWDIHFLFGCYAIDLTVQLYRQHQVAVQSSERDLDLGAQVNKRLGQLAEAIHQHNRGCSGSETLT